MDNTHFLKSEKVALKPIELGEVGKLSKLIAKWDNDGSVTYYMFRGQKPKNSAQIAADLKKQLEGANDVVFLIVDLKTKKPIGYAGLYEIHQTARHADLRILIGEKAFWGKGYGTEVTELLTFYGFDRLNLNRIALGFTADNKAASRAYEKAGYKYEGTFKEDIYRNSRYYDTVRMAILKKDYYKNFYKLHVKRFKAELFK